MTKANTLRFDVPHELVTNVYEMRNGRSLQSANCLPWSSLWRPLIVQFWWCIWPVSRLPWAAGYQCPHWVLAV